MPLSDVILDPPQWVCSAACEIVGILGESSPPPVIADAQLLLDTLRRVEVEKVPVPALGIRSDQAASTYCQAWWTSGANGLSVFARAGVVRVQRYAQAGPGAQFEPEPTPAPGGRHPVAILRDELGRLFWLAAGHDRKDLSAELTINNQEDRP